MIREEERKSDWRGERASEERKIRGWPAWLEEGPCVKAAEGQLSRSAARFRWNGSPMLGSACGFLWVGGCQSSPLL